MGAPLGNRNGAKENRLWGDALKRAVAQNDGEKLRTIADKLIALASDGDVHAIKELGDRLDGRPRQQIEAVDDEGRTLAIGLIAYKPADHNPAPLQPEAVSTTRTPGD